MDRLTIRKATAADMPRIAELIAGDPRQRSDRNPGWRQDSATFRPRDVPYVAGIAGVDRAALSQRQTAKLSALSRLDLEETGKPHAGRSPSSPSGRLAFLVCFALCSRARARDRVHIRPPEGACHITEIDVDPRYRGRGIGGDAARSRRGGSAAVTGYKQMSLSTTTTQPGAQPLRTARLPRRRDEDGSGVRADHGHRGAGAYGQRPRIAIRLWGARRQKETAP